MIIRTASINDLEKIYHLESICFPINESAKKKDFKDRLTYYPNHFLLLFLNEQLIAFIDGFCTNHRDLFDEMYDDASMHDENGKWQMIFGLNTHPNFRNKGYASKLITIFINNAEKENKLGVVLTCKKEMVDYYSKFGFADEGISKSTHGGEIWYQMRLTF